MSELEAADSAELCGLDGDAAEVVTKGEVNRFIRTVNYYHGRPMKRDIKDLKAVVDATNTLLRDHVVQYQIFQAKLIGARWTLWLVGGLLAACVALLLQVLQALKILGVA
jgi:hypothetical protein